MGHHQGVARCHEEEDQQCRESTHDHGCDPRDHLPASPRKALRGGTIAPAICLCTWAMPKRLGGVGRLGSGRPAGRVPKGALEPKWHASCSDETA
eukprot:15444628-Alexandrium_andersonii.AAC.1